MKSSVFYFMPILENCKYLFAVTKILQRVKKKLYSLSVLQDILYPTISQSGTSIIKSHEKMITQSLDNQRFENTSLALSVDLSVIILCITNMESF